MSNTYKIVLYILTLLCSMAAFGQRQIITTNLNTPILPKEIKFTGKIKTAVLWKDKLGENSVLTTETAETISKTAPLDDSRDAALYAYHYIVGKDSTYLTWKVSDFINECPVDIEANFIKNTFQVTDLNNDEIGEVWLMYKIICHGDLSPCDMKIIMYQGQQKYTMRGQNKVRVSEKEFYGGDYKFDNAFTEGPAEFKDFAIKLWDKNIMQKWED